LPPCSLNPPPPTATSPLSLHDALPISYARRFSERPSPPCLRYRPTSRAQRFGGRCRAPPGRRRTRAHTDPRAPPSTTRAARQRQIGRAHVELQSRFDLVCRLLLEKKNK